MPDISVSAWVPTRLVSSHSSQLDCLDCLTRVILPCNWSVLVRAPLAPQLAPETRRVMTRLDLVVHQMFCKARRGGVTFRAGLAKVTGVVGRGVVWAPSYYNNDNICTVPSLPPSLPPSSATLTNNRSNVWWENIAMMIIDQSAREIFILIWKSISLKVIMEIAGDWWRS